MNGIMPGKLTTVIIVVASKRMNFFDVEVNMISKRGCKRREIRFGGDGYEILSKRQLGPRLYEMRVHAPEVVRHTHPGQFVIVMVTPEGKSVPLTIADHDVNEESITIVFQTVGPATMLLSTKVPGEKVFAVRGPLGHPTVVRKFERPVVCVAGGVGVAPLHPVIRAYRAAGNSVLLIMGAREERLLFWEDRMKQYADQTIVCTDIGNTRDVEGSVIIPLREHLLQSARDIDHVFSVGPIGLLSAVSELTRSAGVQNISSVVNHMNDGTGMCNDCHVMTTEGKRIVLCAEGPDVDGNTLRFDILRAKLAQYRSQEAERLAEFAKTPAYQSYLAQEQQFEETGGSK